MPDGRSRRLQLYRHPLVSKYSKIVTMEFVVNLDSGDRFAPLIACFAEGLRPGGGRHVLNVLLVGGWGGVGAKAICISPHQLTNSSGKGGKGWKPGPD